MNPVILAKKKLAFFWNERIQILVQVSPWKIQDMHFLLFQIYEKRTYMREFTWVREYLEVIHLKIEISFLASLRYVGTFDKQPKWSIFVQSHETSTRPMMFWNFMWFLLQFFSLLEIYFKTKKPSFLCENAFRKFSQLDSLPKRHSLKNQHQNLISWAKNICLFFSPSLISLISWVVWPFNISGIFKKILVIHQKL